MPLYEYRCKQCGHVFEKIQSYSAPDAPCPRCGSEVERLLSAPAIQFKGSGFYLTDYGKSGGQAQKSGSTEPGSPSSGEGAKPAATSGDSAPSSGSGTSTPSIGGSGSSGGSGSGNSSGSGSGSAASSSSSTPGASSST